VEEEKAYATEAEEVAPVPSPKEATRSYLPEEHLVQNMILAEMMKLAFTLDLDCLRDFITSQRTYVDTVMPITDPTRYRRESEMLHSALSVAQAGYDFARKAVEARDKAPEVNARMAAFGRFERGEW